jgi:YVTN family beta-propeller protein
MLATIVTMKKAGQEIIDVINNSINAEKIPLLTDNAFAGKDAQGMAVTVVDVKTAEKNARVTSKLCSRRWIVGIVGTLLVLAGVIVVLSVLGRSEGLKSPIIAAYVTGSDIVSIINIATNEVTDTISVGQESTGIVVAPDSSRVYVTSDYTNTISVINTTNNQVYIKYVGDYGWPIKVTVTPDGSLVYVATESYLICMKTSTNQVWYTSPIEKIHDVAVIPDSSQVYLAKRIDDTISVINANSLQVMDTIRIANPIGIAFAHTYQ